MILASVVSRHLIGIEIKRMNTDFKRDGVCLIRVVNMDIRIHLAVIERQKPNQDCQRPTFVGIANHVSFPGTMASNLVFFPGLSTLLPLRRS